MLFGKSTEQKEKKCYASCGVKVLILNGYSRTIADAVGFRKICYEIFVRTMSFANELLA